MTDRGEELMKEDGWIGPELAFTSMKASLCVMNAHNKNVFYTKLLLCDSLD